MLKNAGINILQVSLSMSQRFQVSGYFLNGLCLCHCVCLCLLIDQMYQRSQESGVAPMCENLRVSLTC